MSTRRIALALLLPLAFGCEADSRQPQSEAQFSRAIDGPVTLTVEYEYSTDYDEDLDEVEYDEDEGVYLVKREVTLGPMSECVKPWDQRAEDATCRWGGPSSGWDFSLNVRNVDGVAMLEMDIWAGDIDTSGDASLPIASVPTNAPWTVNFSPDNAGGAWGHVSAKVTRHGQDAPASCCVVCTVGQACGNTCIAADLTCHEPSGCACEG